MSVYKQVRFGHSMLFTILCGTVFNATQGLMMIENAPPKGTRIGLVSKTTLLQSFKKTNFIAIKKWSLNLDAL